MPTYWIGATALFLRLMLSYANLSYSVKLKLMHAYCSSFYSCDLWDLENASINNVCIAWRKGLRQVWCLPCHTQWSVASCMYCAKTCLCLMSCESACCLLCRLALIVNVVLSGSQLGMQCHMDVCFHHLVAMHCFVVCAAIWTLIVFSVQILSLVKWSESFSD